MTRRRCCGGGQLLWERGSRRRSTARWRLPGLSARRDWGVRMLEAKLEQEKMLGELRDSVKRAGHVEDVEGFRRCIQRLVGYEVTRAEWGRLCRRAYVLEAIKQAGGNQSRAAARLGMHRNTIVRVVAG